LDGVLWNGEGATAADGVELVRSTIDLLIELEFEMDGIGANGDFRDTLADMSAASLRTRWVLVYLGMCEGGVSDFTGVLLFFPLKFGRDKEILRDSDTLSMATSDESIDVDDADPMLRRFLLAEPNSSAEKTSTSEIAIG
jgi:hypothetical protein